MGTTNTTTGTNTSNLSFNPLSQGIYNQLTQGGSNVLLGYMNDPFGNPAYTMGAAQSQKGAQQSGANNMSALMQNMLTSGMGGQAGAGFKQAQLAQTGRANQAMSSQANVQNVLQAIQRQMMAAGTGLSFSPQLTGQSGNFNQNQTSSGLGTFLPQLLSSVGGIAMMGAMGAADKPSGGLNPKGGPTGAPSGLDSLMSPGTWGGISGLTMPPMAGTSSGGLGNMIPSTGQGSFNPFFAGMFNQQSQ